MRQVTVTYHAEPEGYWAESPEVPGFSAAGATLIEVRDMVREGLEFHFDERVQIIERFPETITSVVTLTTVPSALGWFASADVVQGQTMSQAAGRSTAKGVPVMPPKVVITGTGVAYAGR